MSNAPIPHSIYLTAISALSNACAPSFTSLLDNGLRIQRVSQAVFLAPKYKRLKWLSLGENYARFPFMARLMGKKEMQALAAEAERLHNEISLIQSPIWLPCERTIHAHHIDWEQHTLVIDKTQFFPACVIAEELSLPNDEKMLLVWQAHPCGQAYQMRILLSSN